MTTVITKNGRSERAVHTREELLGIIEKRARARRGMSAEELLSAYREGTLEDPGEVLDLVIIGDLLPPA